MAQAQGRLNGITGEQVPEIEEAAADLRKLQSKRAKLAEQEEKARLSLCEVLKKHGYGRKKYMFDILDDETGKEVKLDVFTEKVTTERARVRIHKDEKKKEGESEEAGD
jgi:hypothetical protein